MRRAVLLLIASLLFLLPACAPADDFQGGRPITQDDLSAISEELFTTTQAPNDPAVADTQAAEESETKTLEGSETQDTVATEPDPNLVVYYLTTGSVYHLSPDCSHIAGKENVNQATVQEAEENGRRLCKTCEKKSQNN